MENILAVFGTWPEAINIAMIPMALKNLPEVEARVCVTGQHRELLHQVLEIFSIVLDLMREGQDLYDLSCRVLLGMRWVLAQCRPDMVLVHGDTTTTFAATLAAFYQKIPVVHVEAGLRTHDLHSPWPKEANRCLTGLACRLPLRTHDRQQGQLGGGGGVTGLSLCDRQHCHRCSSIHPQSARARCGAAVACAGSYCGKRFCARGAPPDLGHWATTGELRRWIRSDLHSPA